MSFKNHMEKLFFEYFEYNLEYFNFKHDTYSLLKIPFGCMYIYNLKGGAFSTTCKIKSLKPFMSLIDTKIWLKSFCTPKKMKKSKSNHFV